MSRFIRRALPFVAVAAIAGVACQVPPAKKPPPPPQAQPPTEVGPAPPGVQPPVFFQGFEDDAEGWFATGEGTITRTASGTNGIDSATGGFHAVVTNGTLNGDGAFTRFRFGDPDAGFPANGLVTELDVYLDMAEANGADKRFDWIVNFNEPEPPENNHRRDYDFHVGTKPGEPGTWMVSASFNAPGNPSGDSPHGDPPIEITQSGWYTLRHTFTDGGGGVISALLEVVNSSGTVVGSWTLSNATDIIDDTIGRLRVGWLAIYPQCDGAGSPPQCGNQDFDPIGSIAIDNSMRDNL